MTTPHRAAQQVSVRAAQMFRNTNMRVLGTVENMSFRSHPDGSREELLGAGRGKVLAREVEIPLLG